MGNSNLKMVYLSDAIHNSMDLKSLHENVLQINFLDEYKLVDRKQSYILYPNFIRNEVSFKERFKKFHKYNLDCISLINPYKFFMYDQDLDLMMEDTCLDRVDEIDCANYVDENNVVRLKINRTQKFYYNKSGEMVLMVTYGKNVYFAECYIDNQYHVFSTESQLMCMMMKILIERNESNYVLFSNEQLKFDSYFAHIESWNYRNYKLIAHINNSVYNKRDKRQYKSLKLRNLFNQNTSAILVSEYTHIVEGNSNIEFLPKAIINRGNEKSPNNIVLVDLWKKWLNFDSGVITASSESTDNIKKKKHKRSKSDEQSDTPMICTIEPNTYHVKNIDVDSFSPTGDEISIVCKNTSILLEASLDSHVREIVKKLIKNDYMLNDNDLYVSKFIKRELLLKEIETSLEENHFIENNIFWTKSDCENPKKILVVFSAIPALAYKSSRMLDRCFTQNYYKISENVLEDTLIVRIADLNGIYGSYYTNTINYPDYENNISKTLESIRNRYGLEKTDVTLYGASKGGYGALLHGLKLGYNILSSDPIVTMQFYNFKTDMHYMQSMELVPRVDNIKSLLKKELTQKVYILVSSTASNQTIENTKIIKDFYEINKGLTVIDVMAENVRTHADVTAKTVNVQNVIFNKLLLSEDEL